MNSSEGGFIPKIVQLYINDLESRGLPYEIHYDLPAKIKLIMRTDRVYADATFKQGRRGWYNHKPKLTVDGIACEHAGNFDELKMIVEAPDLYLKLQEMRDAFPNGFTYRTNPPHPEHGVELELVPERVRAHVNVIRTKLGEQVELRYEQTETGWQIRVKHIQDAPGDFVVMFRRSHGSWEVERVMLVVVPGDGELGLDLGSSLTEALSGMARSRQSVLSVGPVTRARQAPGPSQTLEVKRHTVIRN